MNQAERATGLGSGPYSRSTDVRADALVVFVLAALLLSDRIQVTLPGDVTLTGIEVAAPVAAVATIWRLGTWRTTGFLFNPVFLLMVLPYLVMTVVLPILGVALADYGIQTLWASTRGTTAVAFLVIGAALSHSNTRTLSVGFLVVICIQLLYSLGQAAYWSGVSGSELLLPLIQWDESIIAPGTELISRSTGLLSNANSLGTWAAVAAVLAMTMLSARLRWFGVGAAVATLLLSQSRGATVALLSALIVGLTILALRGMATHQRLRSGLVPAIAIIVGVPVAFTILAGGDIGTRYQGLLALPFQGVEADANLAARASFWSGVIEQTSAYPFGTLGPPIARLGTIDNEYVLHIGQGSVLYLTALILLLAAPFLVRGGPRQMALWLTTVVVVVAALTQSPFGYPIIIAFWVLLGSGLQSDIERDVMRFRTHHAGWRRAVDSAGLDGRPVEAGESPYGT